MTSRNDERKVRINMRRLTQLLREIEVDEDGRGIPTLQAMDRIEREYPDEHPGRKYHLAQAQMLIDALEQAKEVY